jgi:hypothetical protein
MAHNHTQLLRYGRYILNVILMLCTTWRSCIRVRVDRQVGLKSSIPDKETSNIEPFVGRYSGLACGATVHRLIQLRDIT